MGCLLWLTQFLCLFFFHFHFQATSSSSLSSNLSFSQVPCQFDQSHALLQFKNSFSISSFASDYYHPYASYPKTDSWEEGTDCCLWDGVTCDSQTGYVIGLDLSSSMLFGTFHSNNSLFLLSHLQILDLSNNNFKSSNISSRFSEFLNLRYLNLNSSGFAGLVPLEISYLSSLVSLDISGNYLLTLEATTFNKLAQNLTKLRELSLNEVNMSMVAPSSLANLSSSLLSLKLGSCYLQGNFLEYVHLSNRLVSLDLSWNDLKLQTTSFSKLLQNLTNLRELKLSFVNLSSVAPSSFMNLSSSLHTLKLKHCGLHVNFVDYIHSSTLISLDLSSNYDFVLDTIMFNKLVQNLPSLREVDLSFVNMSLVEPISLMNLSSSLSSLQLWHCGLRGEFPANLLQRPNLQVLYLGFNDDLIGCLPRSNWSCSLEGLSLSYTKIAIHLEGDLINNLRSVRILDLEGCNFVGSNAALFGNLRQLSELYLSSKNFSGQIPLAFRNLEQLIYLDLSFNNFSGPIPPWLANLKQLFYLSLRNNNLSGPIPPWLANLKQLCYLYLSDNNLSGTIPIVFANFTQLRYLQLSNNRLVGPIPHLMTLTLNNNNLTGYLGPFQDSQLDYIDLSNNKLHGPIPSSIFKLLDLSVLILSSNKLTGEVSTAVCNLKFLQILDLSNNSLNGFIPQCLGNFSNTLSVLHLGMNNFHGIIPDTFSVGSNLRYLNLNGNQLQRRIPPSISNCRNLEILDLGNNNIEDTFPQFLETLPELQILVLQTNKLHGLVKRSATNYSFSKLRIFDLSNNMFSGPLPVEYFNNFKAMTNFDVKMEYMRDPNNSYDYFVSLTLKGLEIELVKIQTLLTTIDLSGNKFTGDIPQLIGKLKSLKQLNLSHNQLTGNIQPSLGNLSNLESLDLSSNLLVGIIPMQLVDLTFLEVFRVSHNRLEGLIPQGKQFNTFDSSSYEGNLGLCGFPLEKCNNEERQQPVASKEKDSESPVGFGWKAVLAGYGCGVIFGIAMGYVVFKTRTPVWFVRMVEGYQKPKRFKSKATRTRKTCQRN